MAWKNRAVSNCVEIGNLLASYKERVFLARNEKLRYSMPIYTCHMTYRGLGHIMTFDLCKFNSRLKIGLSIFYIWPRPYDPNSNLISPYLNLIKVNALKNCSSLGRKRQFPIYKDTDWQTYRKLSMLPLLL